ncbi:cationic amino acid transporter 3, mitochondrial-like [Medicago truncatula]|uniref:cationic amino acid transporter 3, mitochondrial-like n=1 Tax=Medicago truncatula TaxID=3880 RepID=UPI00196764A6|nr:cationic amino acid transporter 3, mitochondrial-like [Medicago truncatula]
MYVTISSVRFALCGVGGIVLLSGFVFLTCIDQDNARHSFGHSEGFKCPLVPLLPITCILINSYLLISRGGAAWLRVSVWLAVGVIIYVFYGRTHSSLKDAVLVKDAQVDNTTSLLA